MSLLRQLFGPSREEIWRQLSRELDGRYVDSTFWKSGKVHADHGEWTITLDTYTNGKVYFTRLRAPYVNPDGFRFTVYRRSVFSDVGKLFGMQDVEIGDADFDDAYIVKGTDERKLKQLFRNRRIRALIEAQPDIHFSVKDDEPWPAAKFPPETDQLVVSRLGGDRDIVRLRGLFELFAETLDELCRMGSAYEGDPGVEH